MSQGTWQAMVELGAVQHQPWGDIILGILSILPIMSSLTEVSLGFVLLHVAI